MAPKKKAAKKSKKKQETTKDVKTQKVVEWHRKARQWRPSHVVAKAVKVGSARTVRRLRFESFGPNKGVHRLMVRRARQRATRIRVEDLEPVAKNGLWKKKKKV